MIAISHASATYSKSILALDSSDKIFSCEAESSGVRTAFASARSSVLEKIMCLLLCMAS